MHSFGIPMESNRNYSGRLPDSDHSTRFWQIPSECPWNRKPEWLRLQPTTFRWTPTFCSESTGICRNSWGSVKTSIPSPHVTSPVHTSMFCSTTLHMSLFCVASLHVEVKMTCHVTHHPLSFCTSPLACCHSACHPSHIVILHITPHMSFCTLPLTCLHIASAHCLCTSPLHTTLLSTINEFLTPLTPIKPQPIPQNHPNPWRG
jgi:hypothetical protein